MNSKISKIINITTFCTTTTTIIGAIYYRFFNLNLASVFLILSLSLIVCSIILYLLNKINLSNKAEAVIEHKIDLNEIKKYPLAILSFSFISIFVLELFLLFKFRSNLSIISPWQVVPSYFFLLIFILGLIVAMLFYFNSKYKLILTILFAFLFNSIAIVIYKFGFGYDFFVHQATMELIDKVGYVDPRPLYYLGQYSLIIILHKISFIPIYYLHLLLVPLLASVLIPFNLYLVLEKITFSKNDIFFSILFLLCLPLGLFFSTTPQNFAFLLLLLVIIRGLNVRNYFDLATLFSLSLLALLTQPIAGIPSLFLSLATTVHHSDFKKIKNHLYRLIFIFTAISLPLAFTLLNKLNDIQASPSPIAETNKLTSWFLNLAGFFNISLPQQETAVLNFIYFFADNIKILLIVGIISGIYIVYKHNLKYQIYKIYLLVASGLFISFIITQNLSFDYLIDYERADYATRIFSTTLLLLFPFLLITIVKILNSLRQKNLVIKLIFLGFFLVLIPTFLYLNYPRLDNYSNAHGYAMGQDDIDAVHWIKNDASVDYIVLANQQTSIAALREFGFDKYYETDNKEQIFYYPIPTGGPLYGYFLNMVDDEPSRETILQAMDFANVNTGYFVINKYWWASSKIIDEAKLAADSFEIINKGNIYIFKFSK